MKRIRTVVLSVIAVAVNIVGGPAAHASVASTPPTVISVAANDAKGTTLVLPCHSGLPICVWDAEAFGVVDYDNDVAGDQLADAECNTNDHSTEGPGLLDAILYPLGLEPSPINEWQRYRYVPPTNPEAITGLLGLGFFGDTLDLEWGPVNPVDGNPFLLPVEWIPGSPTVVDYSEPAGPGIVVGCDTGTHSYDTLVLSDGVDATNFTFVDTYYPDNGGSFTVVLHEVA
jgi:hypothetical protein